MLLWTEVRGALDIVTAAGTGRWTRCREPVPGAESRSWTWGQAGVSSGAGREQGRQSPVSWALGCLLQERAHWHAEESGSDGKGGSLH